MAISTVKLLRTNEKNGLEMFYAAGVFQPLNVPNKIKLKKAYAILDQG